MPNLTHFATVASGVSFRFLSAHASQLTSLNVSFACANRALPRFELIPLPRLHTLRMELTGYDIKSLQLTHCPALTALHLDVNDAYAPTSLPAQLKPLVRTLRLSLDLTLSPLVLELPLFPRLALVKLRSNCPPLVGNIDSLIRQLHSLIDSGPRALARLSPRPEFCFIRRLTLFVSAIPPPGELI